jgi:hypothetical protein
MGDARKGVVVVVRGGGVKHDELALDGPRKLFPANRRDGHAAHYMSSIVCIRHRRRTGVWRGKILR